ncbi:MAG: ABC transporter permease [Bacteroidales bacterium]|nr:ABC transporter permease [Bacteroidales bacterium]
MRTILNIIQKEFIQIFRNKTILPIIFIAPIIQMVILVFAATFEMKEIKFSVVDMDMSPISRRLSSAYNASPFYAYKGHEFNMQKAEDKLRSEEIDMILSIPAHFEENLIREDAGSVQFLINAVNSSKASLINAYSSAILMDVNKKIRMEILGLNPGDFKTININTSFWYNPELNYKIYMLPGILVILVTLIGMFLAALNLVREKELGTAEQINVTPIGKFQFILGKLFPFWIIALFELAFGLIIGKIFFHLPTLGNIGLLFAFAGLYLIVVLGIGLFLSTLSSNQQQVMFMAFFFMLTFILMSGIFTPVESMPNWAQKVNIVNPFAYFMKVIRMILLKGSGFKDIQHEIISMSVYAIGIISLASWRYKKVS